jgi:hypothetical protein
MTYAPTEMFLAQRPFSDESIPWWKPWRRFDVRHSMFERDRADLWVQLSALSSSEAYHPQYELAVSYLRETDNFQRPEQLNSAWSLLYRAKEQLILTYDAERVVTDACILRTEVGGLNSIPDWRCQVIKEILRQEAPADLDDRRMRLQRAYWVRNQGQIETFTRLRLIRHFQLLLALVGAVVLGVTIWLVWHHASHFQLPSWRISAWPGIFAAAFGVLGAVVSAAQRSLTIDPVVIADHKQVAVATFSRIPIGAVAGLTVWLFTIASLGPALKNNLNVGDLLLAAFAAGFAERLIVQSAKPDTPPPPKSAM